MIDKLEAALAAGQDSALVRFSLGEVCYREGQIAKACAHLQKAVDYNPQYSAAWKMLGRARAANEQPAEARDAFEQGIAIAQQRGDKQAEREMNVFLARISKQMTGDE
ncbi:tetratricopeptide repeat protein [bacterium]|nr:tetratricopeptide repeat protein [bacterium]